LRKTLLLLLLLFSSLWAYAQYDDKPRLIRPNQIYLGVEGSGLMNFSAFADNRTVDQGFRKPPLPTAAGGLAVRQNLTYRLALETGLSVIDLGYKSVYTFDYQGGKRWESQSTGTSKFGLIQIPVRIVYLLPKKESFWRKYLSLGANGFYNEYWDLPWNVGGQGSFTGPKPGETFPFSDSRYPSPRLTVGLALGAGLERELGSRGLLQVGVVYNHCFKPITVWNLEYTTWNISQTVDGITYRNTIVNKGSFVGLRFSVLFGL